MADHVSADTVVAGAGVIGLAVARALAVAGHDVIIVEREHAIGSHTSARNSEVIHAGLYYDAGSFKARMCVAGKHQLYAYCAARRIPHARCGKLVVATEPGEVAALTDIKARAAANGVEDLQVLDQAQAVSLEPHLACTAALLSPSTGIIDSHALMLSYRGDAEDNGAAIAFATAIDRVEADGRGFVITTGDATVRAKRFVNAAGLWAPQLAAAIDCLNPQHVPRAYFCKGTYYALQGRAPFTRLIYPVPQAAGLGVHLTLDLAGQARFGPDVEWVSEVEYTVDPARAAAFYAAIRRYWPGLRDGALMPAYAGIRPKLSPAGAPADDFRIDGPAEHGVAGLVNLFGIESPGITASLAIAEHVAAQLS